jgi:hypothetical protein
MKLKCGHCKYEWNYLGENPYFATCPRCLRKVSVWSRRASKKVLYPLFSNDRKRRKKIIFRGSYYWDILVERYEYDVETLLIRYLINAPGEGWTWQKTLEEKIKIFLFNWRATPEMKSGVYDFKRHLKKYYRLRWIEDAEIIRMNDKTIIATNGEHSVKFTLKKGGRVILETHGKKHVLLMEGELIVKPYGQPSLSKLVKSLEYLLEARDKVSVTEFIPGAPRGHVGKVIRVRRDIETLKKIYDSSDDLFRHLELVKSPYFYSLVPSLVKHFSEVADLKEEEALTLAFWLSSGRPRMKTSSGAIAFDNPSGVLDYVLDDERYTPPEGVSWCEFLEVVKNDPCVMRLEYIYKEAHVLAQPAGLLSEDRGEEDKLLRLKQAATILRTAEELGIRYPSISRFNEEWSVADERSQYFLPRLYEEILLSLVKLERKEDIPKHDWVEKYPGGISDLCVDLVKVGELFDDFLWREINVIEKICKKHGIDITR